MGGMEVKSELSQMGQGGVSGKVTFGESGKSEREAAI